MATVSGAINTVVNTASNAFENVTNSFMGNKSNKSKPSNQANIFPFTSNTSNVMTPASMNAVASSPIYPLIIFGGILVVTIICFTRFHDQIQQGWEYTINMVRQALGYSVETNIVSEIKPASGDITELTKDPKELNPEQDYIVERILPAPSERKEVFNVSENTYNYYDAEPLCKALGAELATYDQVKEAWEKGADWCNYGWVKGQMAVYPTQKETYDELQNGPADGRGACGTVGINGGHFDNPDLQYGVNCYGKKPSQVTPVDPDPPQTPGMIEFNKKVKEFAHDTPKELLPFNEDKWSGRP